MKSIHCQNIAMSTSILSYICCKWSLIFLYIVVSSIVLLAANSIHAIRFCTWKVTTKSDVVGCHVGQWPSSTNWNRYTIPFDCCVNAFLPLLSSMGSFTAKMVVLRSVCEVPTFRQKCSHVGSIHPPHPSSITDPIQRHSLSVCILFVCPRHSIGCHWYQNSRKITPFFMHQNNKNRA